MVRVLALLFLVPHAIFAADPHRLRATPLFTISYAPPSMSLEDRGAIAFSDRFVYFGTEGGLFRAPLPIDHSTRPQRIAFESEPVTGLAIGAGKLYATLDVANLDDLDATSGSLLESIDDGATWMRIDAALEECYAGLCRFLRATEIELAGDRIFVNAGGNVLVSGDEGASWKVLFGATSTGKPQAQACYLPTFALVGQQLLFGGECPLDIAYLRTGTLTADLLDWQAQPESAATPFLENRNVMVLRRRGDTNVVYAGIEGALLRSSDAGASYEFLFFHEGNAAKYPYITHILLPSQHPSMIIAGGFDKANGGPFLSTSFDNGATWSDQSGQLPGAGFSHWSVSALEETPSGQILVGAKDNLEGALHLFELQTTTSTRRRSVAH